MTFLEWNSPDNVIERSKVYLFPDSPVFIAITSHRHRLANIRRVRNAIAHCSAEAQAQFLKVVRDELGVAPLKSPSVGEFLIMDDAAAPIGQYYLRSYLDVLVDVAEIAAD